MLQISIVGDARICRDDFCREFDGKFEIEFKPLDSIVHSSPARYTLLDTNLNDDTLVLQLKDWLKRKPKDAKVIFVTDKASRLQDARAFALGATDVIHNPIDRRALMTKLCGDSVSPDADQQRFEQVAAPAVAATADTLQSIFSSVAAGGPIDSSAIHSAGDAVIGEIEAQGLGAWVDTVRMHHSQTYQHCLLVTGVAAAFGQKIGLSRADCQRLSFAGMLHDLGKARIPLAILEKPGPLDANELAEMRKHPQYGYDALTASSSLPAEMLDMVVHHHEYLDGSGYPHRLHGREICDLVRIMTISDVFGALIERRSYKPPLSGDAAYQILVDMGPKLDVDLVRAFKAVTQIDSQRLEISS
jgi:putative nucleotidyltransferase with HDIG domain